MSYVIRDHVPWDCLPVRPVKQVFFLARLRAAETLRLEVRPGSVLLNSRQVHVISTWVSRSALWDVDIYLISSVLCKLKLNIRRNSINLKN